MKRAALLLLVLGLLAYLRRTRVEYAPASRTWTVPDEYEQVTWA